MQDVFIVWLQFFQQNLGYKALGIDIATLPVIKKLVEPAEKPQK